MTASNICTVTKPDPIDDADPFFIGETALANAVRRIHECHQSWPETPIAAGEALWWCSSLDDCHRARIANAGAYWSHRNASEAGKTVAGLLYARNLTGHQLVTVPGFVTVGPPLIEPTLVWDEEQQCWCRVGLEPVELRWLPLSALSRPTKPERNRRDTYYSKYVGDRRVAEPLEVALDFFSRIVWSI